MRATDQPITCTGMSTLDLKRDLFWKPPSETFYLNSQLQKLPGLTHVFQGSRSECCAIRHLEIFYTQWTIEWYSHLQYHYTLVKLEPDSFMRTTYIGSCAHKWVRNATILSFIIESVAVHKFQKNNCNMRNSSQHGTEIFKLFCGIDGDLYRVSLAIGNLYLPGNVHKYTAKENVPESLSLVAVL